MSVFFSTGSTLDLEDPNDSPISKEISPSNFNQKAQTITSFPSLKLDNLQYIPEEPFNDNDSIVCITEEPFSYTPMELIFNFDSEKQALQSNPFLIYDKRLESSREMNSEDGFLYFWSKFKHKDHNPLKYVLCVTIFSEPLEELQSTLAGIYKNAKLFKKFGISEQQLCVIVLFDGVKAISPDIRKKIFNKLDKDNQISTTNTLDVREEVFLNDLDRISRDSANIMPLNSCYLYEWDYAPDEELNSTLNPIFTIKTLLAVKLQNASKMSSIVWFFRGFCEVLTPQYCGLMDCGTIPDSQAIWLKFMAFESDEDIGGLCGLMLPKCPVVYDNSEKQLTEISHPFVRFFYRTFDIKSSQLFEYALGHIIDKSFESILGFMYVLPGAFCSFRWKAICKDESDLSSNFLDQKFVKIINDSNYKTSNEYTLAEGNLCQAEDQVISFDVTTRAGCKYKTKYLPDALAWTDPVKTFPVLMKQRKRWINGSWFAFQFSLGVFFEKMNKTMHHPLRKFGFYMFMFYMIGQNVNRYLIISYIFSLFLMMSQEFLNEYYWVSAPMMNTQVFYIFYFLTCLYLIYYYSVVYKADKGISKFETIATFFGFSVHIFTIILVFRLFETLQLQDYSEQDDKHIDLRIIYMFVGFNFLYYVIPFLLNVKTCGWDIIKTGLAFFYHFPLYMIFFQIYAFCNIDDLSWGTKAKENLSITAKIANNRIINAKFVGKWLFINFIIGFFVMILISNMSFRVYFILVLGFIYTFMAMIKFFGAIIFKVKYDLFDSKKMKKTVALKKEQYSKESNEIFKALMSYP